MIEWGKNEEETEEEEEKKEKKKRHSCGRCEGMNEKGGKTQSGKTREEQTMNLLCENRLETELQELDLFESTTCTHTNTH